MKRRNLYILLFILLIFSLVFPFFEINAATLINCSNYGGVNLDDCENLDTPEADYCYICKTIPDWDYSCFCSETEFYEAGGDNADCDDICAQESPAQKATFSECCDYLMSMEDNCDLNDESMAVDGCEMAYNLYKELCNKNIPYTNEEIIEYFFGPEDFQISPIEQQKDSYFFCSDAYASDELINPVTGKPYECSAENLEQCWYETECTGVGAYWYDEECHAEPPEEIEETEEDGEGQESKEEDGEKSLQEAISKVEAFMGKGPIKGEMISGDVPTIVGKALRVFLGIVGSLALAIFVYGGIMWMISGGNPERIKKAQGTIVWSVLGLMVIFLSYVIVSMIISGITHESKIIEQQAEQRDACLEQCIEERDEALAQCQDLASKTDTGEIDEDEYELCVKSARSRAENCRDICRERFQ